MATGDLETEKKFHVEMGWALPPIEGQGLPPRRFTSTYYDTDSRRLAVHGLTLRYRSEARRGRWQLKIPRTEGRRELEFRGAGRRMPRDLVRLLLAYQRGQRIRPVATLRTSRIGVRVRQHEGQANVLLDAVAVLRGRKVVERFSEVELEHRGIEDPVLDELTRRLEEAGAEPSPCMPKVFRVLGLPLPSFSTMPDPDAGPAEHLKAVLRRHEHHLLIHDPGTRLGTDPEDLHQLRVATRKLRAIFRAARPMLSLEWAEALRGELAWLGDALGPARDLDVFLSHLLQETENLSPAEQNTLAPLRAALERERSEAQTVVVRTLEQERYLRLLERLEAAAEAPEIKSVEVSLVNLARSDYKKLKRAMQDCPADPAPAWLHRLRILGKRARYAAELAEPAGGKPVSRFMEQVKAFQDLLGEHQDAAVAEARLRKCAGETSDPLTSLVLGRLIERQYARQQRARARLAGVWKKVKKRGRTAWEA
ncbi:CHAD domain-containing protein [Nitrospira moscoviensis]|uniref:CYTH and CHAD domain-containing protein n=1 Tax=Nitrospira moscoviensis TaxID=42253 RepID=A0A0K2GJH4_NITMO|nr:CHAD domain-containing protein [Nitrospira moscoviensis]ALA61103.1 conserved protein of unknown function with CHAD domain (modular) [Nitrospira moscoviensis]